MRVFVTGASGWIGSAAIPELVDAGHDVVGLARSDSAAALVERAGASVQRGSLDDLDVLREASGASDGVIHLAFKHDIAFSGDFDGAATADRRAIETIGDALVGSDRPFVIASGVLGLLPGGVATETDGLPDASAMPVTSGPDMRRANAHLTLSYADRGVRSSVVRLPPTVHGTGDNGFMAMLVNIARATGVSGYIGDGAQRWPAVHCVDAARLFRLAFENAPAGSVLHAVAEEGVPIRDIADVIGRSVGCSSSSVALEEFPPEFTWLAFLLTLDSPASSESTRALLDWHPTGPGLIDDLAEGYYVAMRQ